MRRCPRRSPTAPCSSGAGGAGVAVGYGLLEQGAEHVAVFDEDRERAEACVVRLAKRYGDDRIATAGDLESALADAGGVVNATPVGMQGHPGTAVPAHLLRSDLWVSDVVYFPLETELIALARARAAACFRAAAWRSTRRSARSSCSPDAPLTPHG